jgi:hypothetical protein
VYQYDLTAVDIKASKQTIQMYPDTGQLQYVQIGHLLLGPDDKIYISKGNGSGVNSNTVYTQNLDVILNPDVVGLGCNYQSNYFYLNGGLATYGFPNMVNYDLGPVGGSICDSLRTGITVPNYVMNTFIISPNPVKDYIHINQSLNALQSNGYKVSIYDVQGRLEIEKDMQAGNFSIHVADLIEGVYIIKITSNDGVCSKRFLKLNSSFK